LRIYVLNKKQIDQQSVSQSVSQSSVSQPASQSVSFFWATLLSGFFGPVCKGPKSKFGPGSGLKFRPR